LRGIDVLGRLGGEEFAVLLPHTDIKGALTVAEYLRAAIEKAEFKLFSETVNVTASFGVSGLLDKDKQIKTVLGRADSALYEAKRNGRNQVVLNLDGEPAEFAVALS
jgi:diguanylate cyclase (GGDEF)-like protein